MDLEQARDIIADYLKKEFGKVVELREVSVVRKTSGRIWVGKLHCVTSGGEVEVGSIGVDIDGRIVDNFGVDQLVEALSRLGHFQGIEQTDGASGVDPFAGETSFADFDFDEEVTKEVTSSAVMDEDTTFSSLDAIDGFFSSIDGFDIKNQVKGLIASGEREDLLKARESMPQLLVNPDERGMILKQMGEVEFKLGEEQLGLEYIEAAAREFADRADIDSLEQLVELTLQSVGHEGFDKHPIKDLLDQTYARLQPISSIHQATAFAGLGDEAMFEIEGAAEQISVNEGDVVLKEGDKAVQAFVIKSGILSVRLQTPDGGTQVVRCCFPGDFIGESSVLGDPEATCNATLRAECATGLWCFDGARLRELAIELPELRARINAARDLHQLDSFFSMNKATDTLDVRVRDRLLSCIMSICRADPGSILGAKGSVPPAVYLLAQGRIEYRRPGLPPRVYEPDSFVGLSDTLHELALDGDFVATEPCRLIRFDIEGLKAMAADAPPDVIAVLERLE